MADGTQQILMATCVTYLDYCGDLKHKELTVISWSPWICVVFAAHVFESFWFRVVLASSHTTQTNVPHARARKRSQRVGRGDPPPGRASRAPDAGSAASGRDRRDRRASRPSGSPVHQGPLGRAAPASTRPSPLAATGRCCKRYRWNTGNRSSGVRRYVGAMPCALPRSAARSLPE